MRRRQADRARVPAPRRVVQRRVALLWHARRITQTHRAWIVHVGTAGNESADFVQASVANGFVKSKAMQRRQLHLQLPVAGGALLCLQRRLRHLAAKRRQLRPQLAEGLAVATLRCLSVLAGGRQLRLQLSHPLQRLGRRLARASAAEGEAGRGGLRGAHVLPAGGLHAGQAALQGSGEGTSIPLHPKVPNPNPCRSPLASRHVSVAASASPLCLASAPAASANGKPMLASCSSLEAKSAACMRGSSLRPSRDVPLPARSPAPVCDTFIALAEPSAAAAGVTPVATSCFTDDSPGSSPACDGGSSRERVPRRPTGGSIRMSSEGLSRRVVTEPDETL
ncbi:hypothetical protein TSOC_003715 [Tetrabaena socialis]|uniref:Uncharacterized protein n=1 Tax=Tetrabaena socialis TaxID=47790 RepID=A0A2J8AAV6_9CHLO|nr:hypothetical protein TSOC_003715 [Tetrabaena socialis]|eukprot:PNH09637.1 hypothetical protein TSOC_003715 [Tetrabaena socialis]